MLLRADPRIFVLSFVILAGQAALHCERIAAGETRTADRPELRAGAQVIDVSPRTFPVLINGGFLQNSATRVNDPSFAKCLVLDDGTTRLAIIIVDSCMMPRELLDRAKEMAREKTGIATDRMLIAATDNRDLGSRIPAVIPTAMLTVADSAVVQPVKAEGVDLREPGQDLGQHLDEEIAVGTEQAEHAPMGIRLQIDLWDLGGPGRDPPPVGVVLIDLSLQARRIDAQDPHAQPLVLGDVSFQPVGRDRGVSSFEELAVVVSIERIDEAHLADRDPVRRGPRSP